MSSKKFAEDSQRSAGAPGVRDARKKANERLGEWIKGKFRLDSLLGVGGMASVYAVTHRNGSRAALKILHAEFTREEAIKQRFLREGYVANKVTHPGVVKILDDDETEHGEAYLMMELLEGETLRQVWKRNKRRLPLRQALRVAGDILDTLVPCHENRVIHRDLKPANIFLCTDGQVKLLDFGVAQLREEGGEALTRAGTALGTPSYMAPEQAQGNSHNLDGRADIFSIGAILYTMLSGKRLLQGKSPNEAFILAATQPAPSLARSTPNLPVEVIALVDKALKWDRRKRFKDAGKMRDACRDILDRLEDEAGDSVAPRSSPVDSSIPPASDRPGSAGRRRRTGDPRSAMPTEPPTRGATPSARKRKRTGSPDSGRRAPDIPLTQIGTAPEAIPSSRKGTKGRRRGRESVDGRHSSAVPPSSQPARRAKGRSRIERSSSPPASAPAGRPSKRRSSAKNRIVSDDTGRRTSPAGRTSPKGRGGRSRTDAGRSATPSESPRSGKLASRAPESRAKPKPFNDPPSSRSPSSRKSSRTPRGAPAISSRRGSGKHSEPPVAIELEEDPRQVAAPRRLENGEHPLKDLFQRFEKQLSTLRQYGLDHPEGVTRVKAIHRAFLDCLQDIPMGVRFQVHPFCFTDGKETVWEPGPPNDQVPYGLASSGVEEIRINRGVTKDEIREFLQVTIIDPQLGLTEGDIGAALWEAGFEHILCKVRDDLTDADAREQIRFFSESEEVEADVREDLARVVEMMAQTARPSMRHQDEVEAAAMALTTDTDMFHAAKMASDAMRLDYAAAKAMAAELLIENDEWRDRFFDLSAEALADVAMREDEHIILDELELYTDRWIKGGMWAALLDVYDRLTANLERYRRVEDVELSPEDITRRIFTWPRLAAAFGYLDDTDADPHVAGLLLEAVSQALTVLDDSLVSEMLRLADTLVAGPLCELALSYVGQHMGTRRDEIMARLDDLRPELAQRVLAAITEDDTPANRELLKPLLMSTNPALRCEATALLASSPEELGKNLVRLLNSQDPRLKSAALTTMLRHNVRHAGPGLVQSIEDSSSLERPAKELRQMLETLYALHPPRAESLLISILSEHGLMSNDALDKKRSVAADVLGRLADSANPIDALEGATRIRPWNTQLLRTTAAEALSSLRLRLDERQGAGAKS